MKELDTFSLHMLPFPSSLAYLQHILEVTVTSINEKKVTATALAALTSKSPEFTVKSEFHLPTLFHYCQRHCVVILLCVHGEGFIVTRLMLTH